MSKSKKSSFIRTTFPTKSGKAASSPQKCRFKAVTFPLQRRCCTDVSPHPGANGPSLWRGVVRAPAAALSQPLHSAGARDRRALRPFPVGGFPRRAHEKGRSRRETASFSERDTGRSSKRARLYTISGGGCARGRAGRGEGGGGTGLSARPGTPAAQEEPRLLFPYMSRSALCKSSLTDAASAG